mgnify:FL=1
MENRERENIQPEAALEEAYLAETIEAAERQLAQTRQAMENRESEITAAKEEIRENTQHGVGSGTLNSAADF